MSKELEQLFEDHTPTVIYPKGLSERIILRTIGEGFIYPEGVFFFDFGWNSPDGGTGSDHFVSGEVEGPFFPDKRRAARGVKRWWRVGKAIIYEIAERFVDDDIYFYEEGEYNKNFAERNKDDTGLGRQRAQKIADRIMALERKVK